MKDKQLFEKINGGYIPIYPLTKLKNIIDDNNNINLSDILQLYNHIYVTKQDTIEETRLLIPIYLRRFGLWISYEDSDGLHTEWFTGSNNDSQNDYKWSNDSNWEIVPDLNYVNSAVSRIPNGVIIPEMLSPALQDFLNKNHNIINFVDDEDLTELQCHIIKFKDKNYNPNLASGKGYKILRKNWINGINVLLEDNINSDNTIYEVRYDFNLKGITINLSENTSLWFKGGSINNGTVNFNGGTIIGKHSFEECGTANFTGTFNKGLIMFIGDSIKYYDGEDWKEFSTNSGPAGPSGDVSVAIQTFIIFKSTGQDSKAPDTPVGGHWNSYLNEFTPPEGWSRDDTLEGIVWMSSASFRSDNGELIDKWSTPVRITGENGTNGTDGNNIEFIFKLTKTSLETPTLDVKDSPDTNEYVPEGWTNSPSGISIENKCEWVSTRNKSDKQKWSNWSNPAIWSKWGVDGVDGDGVEYIFTRNNGSTVENPTPEDINTDQYQEKGNYENIEYIPAGWTDNPQGVNSEYKYEWVCQRKYRNGKWGAFSDPAVWAKFGDDGYSGLNLRTMYAKKSIGETPEVIRNNINPGSIWSSIFPNYDSETEAVWCTQAYITYDNKLATTEDGAAYEGWQGPWIITGTPGINGTPPNYKVYIYKQSDTKPDKPTGTDKLPEGWVDYPNNTGQWWQCIGSVNGVTELVTEWSEVLPVNGKDGTTQDGKKTEFRFDVNNSAYIAPNLTKIVRTPSGWTINPPQLVSGQYLWMTTAVINSDDTLYSNWTDPVRISGERGPQGNTGPAGSPGPAGKDGISGIPGVSIEIRYCLGTESTYDGNSSPTGDSPSGWSTNVLTTTKDKPYIWCIQGKRVYSSFDDDKGTVTWSNPFKLSGTNGISGKNGTDGKRGQLIYPAGVYSNTASYTTDENKAPYVLDTSDDNFYVLNAQMTWKGTEQNNRTPSQDYASNNGKYWLKFDAFEAIYAKLGIISNGLVGSAVFNGDYMFSQQGINPSSSNAPTSNYEEFDPEHIYDGTFTPNILLNFNLGIAHLAAGDIKFSINGTWWKDDSWATGEDDTWKGGLLYANTIFKIPTKQPFPTSANIVFPYIPEGYYGRYIIPLNKTGENRVLGYRGTAKWRYIDSNGDVIGGSMDGNVGPTLKYPSDNPTYAYAECVGYKIDSSTSVWTIKNVSI